MFETTEPVIVPRTTPGRPSAIASSDDDQLGRIAEAGVQEAADSRAGVLGGMLGRLADQPGERDERDRREDERAGRAEVEAVVGDEGDRRQGERCPEDPPRHARYPSRACSKPSSSTGTTRSCSSRGTTTCSSRVIERARRRRDDRRLHERYRELDARRRRRIARLCGDVLRELLGVADGPDAFIDAEHEVWRPGACGARLGARRCSTRCGTAGSRRASSRTPGPSPPASCARMRRPSGSRRSST